MLLANFRGRIPVRGEEMRAPTCANLSHLIQNPHVYYISDAIRVSTVYRNILFWILLFSETGCHLFTFVSRKHYLYFYVSTLNAWRNELTAPLRLFFPISGGLGPFGDRTSKRVPLLHERHWNDEFCVENEMRQDTMEID